MTCNLNVLFTIVVLRMVFVPVGGVGRVAERAVCLNVIPAVDDVLNRLVPELVAILRRSGRI